MVFIKITSIQQPHSGSKLEIKLAHTNDLDRTTLPEETPFSVTIIINGCAQLKNIIIIILLYHWYALPIAQPSTIKRNSQNSSRDKITIRVLMKDCLK